MTVFDRSIDVLEAGYCLAPSNRDWLARVVRAVRDAHPVPGMDAGAAGFYFQVVPGETGLRTWNHASLDVSGEVTAVLGDLHASLPPDALQAMFLQPAAFVTLGQLGVSVGPRARALGIADVLGLQAMDSSGVGCALLFALPAQTRIGSRVRAYWQAVALHLRAAMRLRRDLRAAGPWAHAQLVVEPAHGHGHDQVTPAAAASNGHPGRRMPKAWPTLVSGQWTLVDQFDSDGRRYYVALRNEAGAEALVKLTRREREVLAQAVQGASSKAIADALSSSESTINTHLASAMSKLRIRRRSELPWLDADVDAWQTVVGDSSLLVMRTRDDSTRLLDGFDLTEAEKAVVAGVLAGLSNDEIAHRRGVRPRTVANQMQAIFRKTRVFSRAELCASMTRRG